LTSQRFRAVVYRVGDGVKPAAYRRLGRRFARIGEVTFQRVDNLGEIRRQLANRLRRGESLTSRFQYAPSGTAESTGCRARREKKSQARLMRPAEEVPEAQSQCHFP